MHQQETQEINSAEQIGFVDRHWEDGQIFACRLPPCGVIAFGPDGAVVLNKAYAAFDAGHLDVRVPRAPVQATCKRAISYTNIHGPSVCASQHDLWSSLSVFTSVCSSVTDPMALSSDSKISIIFTEEHFNDLNLVRVTHER